MIHHLPSFVSSSAYYGYVPPPPPTAVPPVDVNMEVEVAVAVGGQHPAPRIPPRKRGSGIDEIAGYMPRFKRFREEAVVTNVFSMMQDTSCGQKNMDLPRCTMGRHFYA